MKSGLEIKRLLTLVLNKHSRRQLIILKSNSERAKELLVPHFFCVVTWSHLKFDSGISHGFHSPVNIPCESVLLNFSWPKLRPAMRKTSTNRLRSIHFGIGPDSDILLSPNLVRGDTSSVEIDVRGTVSISKSHVLETFVIGHKSGGCCVCRCIGSGGAISTSFSPFRSRGDLVLVSACVQNTGRARERRLVGNGAGGESICRGDSSEEDGGTELHGEMVKLI
mmetsp:Transcript_14544/g.29559  ORF Transcript_14544/g.29559 Transcript_14544/m.29559 type:complete len:223 (+) Transcript_14544:1427-2095(+)